MILSENRLSESYHIVLARRMATWATVGYTLLFVGVVVGPILGPFVYRFLSSIPALNKGFVLSLVEISFVVGIVFVLVPTLFSLAFQPQVFDWELDIYNHTGSDELNDRLEALRVFISIQHGLGNLRRRPQLFLSDNISNNAMTYGGFINPPRVVFASDIFASFTRREVQGILCHELGHVHYGDFYIGVAFHYILRLLDFFFMPFRWVYDKIKQLIALTYAIPFVGVLIRFALYALMLVVGIFVLPVWLVRALNSLQGQLREYIADDYAVRIMDDADGILNSLMKLENAQIEVFDPDDEKDGGAQPGPPADGDGSAAKKKEKKIPIKGKFRRYATLIYEVEQVEPETTFQKLYALLLRLNDTHPPGASRWKRIAQVGYQMMNRNGEEDAAREQAF
jgi:Zn-dependent protease with chaperone function